MPGNFICSKEVDFSLSKDVWGFCLRYLSFFLYLKWNYKSQSPNDSSTNSFIKFIFLATDTFIESKTYHIINPRKQRPKTISVATIPIKIVVSFESSVKNWYLISVKRFLHNENNFEFIKNSYLKCSIYTFVFIIICIINCFNRQFLS